MHTVTRLDCKTLFSVEMRKACQANLSVISDVDSAPYLVKVTYSCYLLLACPEAGCHCWDKEGHCPPNPQDPNR